MFHSFYAFLDWIQLCQEQFAKSSTIPTSSFMNMCVLKAYEAKDQIVSNWNFFIVSEPGIYFPNYMESRRDSMLLQMGKEVAGEQTLDLIQCGTRNPCLKNCFNFSPPPPHPQPTHLLQKSWTESVFFQSLILSFKYIGGWMCNVHSKFADGKLFWIGKIWQHCILHISRAPDIYIL